jgi:hypothetical protein
MERQMQCKEILHFCKVYKERCPAILIVYGIVSEISGYVSKE